jgi:type I restriction enzyme, S subunit
MNMEKNNSLLIENALISKEMQPFNVPRNWVWTNIQNVILPMKSRDPKNLDGDVFYYIDVDAIDNKTQSVREVKELEIKQAPSRAKRKVSENDVIISLVRPYLKNIAFLNEQNHKLVASTAFYVCTSSDILYPKYLYFFLCSNYVTQYLIKNTRGDNSPSVRSTDFEKMPIPIPPYKEQQIITEKLERLLGKIEQVKGLINPIGQQMEVLKQSILSKAFKGELGTNNSNN